MSTNSNSLKEKLTKNFSEFSQLSDYSFMKCLKADPRSTKDGNDHKPRSVYSGHYVPVLPTAIRDPKYISHSKKLFKELGLSPDLIRDTKQIIKCSTYFYWSFFRKRKKEEIA